MFLFLFSSFLVFETCSFIGFLLLYFLVELHKKGKGGGKRSICFFFLVKGRKEGGFRGAYMCFLLLYSGGAAKLFYHCHCFFEASFSLALCSENWFPTWAKVKKKEGRREKGKKRKRKGKGLFFFFGWA